MLAEGKVDALNLIIKGDVSGAVEALEEALLKIEVDDSVQLRILHRGVGAVTESDIDLATIDNAIVIGFNVRPDVKARERAQREGIDVRFYSVIYAALEDIESSLKGMLKPEFEEVQSGVAEIREIFRSSKAGNIAGVIVRSGTITRNAKARVIREGVVVGDNLAIDSLRRFKDDVTEVQDGLRGRYRSRQVQRHPDRRRDRDDRDEGEGPGVVDPRRGPGLFQAGTRSRFTREDTMAGQGDRAAKMADRIQEIIAKRIEHGLRDPRLGFVTITDVRVTGDLQHASVFYTVYGTDEERADSALALKAATGMFRTEVGKNITARLTPSLEFIADAIPENAAQIDSLLREARERDAEASSWRRRPVRRRRGPVRQAARSRRRRGRRGSRAV